MNITAYLIERELLARRGVALPFIGMLNYERVSSRFAFDRSHLIPPQNTITLTADSHQQGDQLIDLIAAELGITHDQAIETYNDWYTLSIDCTGANLTIESVCSIDLVCYNITSIDEQFAEHLTPLGCEPIAIGRPLESRGFEPSATSYTTEQIPRSKILETLPIIEDIPYTPIVDQRIEPTPQQRVQPSSNTMRHYAPNHPRQAHARPTKAHPQRPSSTSTVALATSIAIAVIAALYIAYTLLTQYGIINPL